MKHLFLLFLACSQSSLLLAKISYSFIFQIHEDSDHSYHDRMDHDKKKHGHETAYKQARALATSCKNCEVFIFREMKKHLFHSGKVEYFIKGKRKARIYHNRQKDQKDIKFFRKHSKKIRDTKGEIQSFYAYFGHHIPEKTREGYHESFPKMRFSLEHFTERLRLLGAGIEGGYRFDGVILSTCSNGTPFTVRKLTPFTRYLVASPGKIHLSYLDLSPLKEHAKAEKKSLSELFMKIVDKSIETYDKRGIQTYAVVSAYRTSETKPFVDSVGLSYSLNLKNDTRHFPKFKDCREVPLDIFKSAKLAKGVYVKSNTPLFFAPEKPHSGWSWLVPKKSS